MSWVRGACTSLFFLIFFMHVSALSIVIFSCINGNNYIESIADTQGVIKACWLVTVGSQDVFSVAEVQK